MLITMHFLVISPCLYAPIMNRKWQHWSYFTAVCFQEDDSRILTETCWPPSLHKHLVTLLKVMRVAGYECIWLHSFLYGFRTYIKQAHRHFKCYWTLLENRVKYTLLLYCRPLRSLPKILWPYKSFWGITISLNFDHSFIPIHVTIDCGFILLV